MRIEVYNLILISDIVEIIELRAIGKEEDLQGRSLEQEIPGAKDIFNLQIQVVQDRAEERDSS